MRRDDQGYDKQYSQKSLANHGEPPRLTIDGNFDSIIYHRYN